MPARPVDPDLQARARAAYLMLRGLRPGQVDPILLLSYVVWPDVELDDPNAGTTGADVKLSAAA
jgi:hypothetical protein